MTIKSLVQVAVNKFPRLENIVVGNEWPPHSHADHTGLDADDHLHYMTTAAGVDRQFTGDVYFQADLRGATALRVDDYYRYLHTDGGGDWTSDGILLSANQAEWQDAYDLFGEERSILGLITGVAGLVTGVETVNGADGDVVIQGSTYIGVSTSDPTITISLLDHVSTHEDGGSDELNVQGLSGRLADPQIAGWLTSLTYPISTSAPSSGQSLVWNGSYWAPATVTTDITGLTPYAVLYGGVGGGIAQESHFAYDPTGNQLKTLSGYRIENSTNGSFVGTIEGAGTSFDFIATNGTVDTKFTFTDSFLSGQTGGARIADADADVTDFVATFGNTSIYDAINQTYDAIGTPVTLVENRLVFGAADGGFEQDINLAWTDTQLWVHGAYMGVLSQGDGVFIDGKLGVTAGFTDEHVVSSNWPTASGIEIFSSPAQWSEAYAALGDSVGSVWDLINAAAGGNTLEEAYNQGGAGAGRSITIASLVGVSGAVSLFCPSDVDETCLAITNQNSGASSNLVSIYNQSTGNAIDINGPTGTDDFSGFGHLIHNTGAATYESSLGAYGNAYLNFWADETGEYTNATLIAQDDTETEYARLVLSSENGAELRGSVGAGVGLYCSTQKIELLGDGDIYCTGRFRGASQYLGWSASYIMGLSSGVLDADFTTVTQTRYCNADENITEVAVVDPVGVGVFRIRIKADGGTRSVGNFTSATSTPFTFVGNYNLNDEPLSILNGQVMLIEMVFHGATIGWDVKVVTEV
jgi:hypothetical protein